jgi:hypothetical protein
MQLIWSVTQSLIQTEDKSLLIMHHNNFTCMLSGYQLFALPALAIATTT